MGTDTKTDDRPNARCFWPTLLSLASDRISHGSTSLFSLLGAAGVTGCVIYPWVIGVLGDAVGLRGAVLVLPASMALLVMMLLASVRFVRHSGPKPDAPPA